MDPSAQDQILKVLAEAQGDPARLALASVDLRYPDLSADERKIRTALIAAAVPHWFDVPFLAVLLGIPPEEAAILVDQLSRLPNVEPFPARGEAVFNVHEASRLPLREYLRSQQPDSWKTYSLRAHAHVASGTEDHLRIEALFHQFAAHPTEAVEACESLDRELMIDPARRAPLCLSLTELATAGWLEGSALVEALGVPLGYRSGQGETSLLEPEATYLLTLAEKHARSPRVADSHLLLGDIHLAHGHVEKAREAYRQGLDLYRFLCAQDPSKAAWQRDLSVSLDKLGDLAVAQGDLAGAMRSFTESKIIRERLAASDPANAAWQRDLSVSLIKLGDVAVAQGDLAGALRCFTECQTIAEHLAASDLANAEWQRDLAISLDRLGNLAVAQGDLAGALRYYTEDKTIAERLAASDPANAAWQRDLWVSYWKLADQCEKAGKAEEAKAWWKKAFDTLSGMKARGLHLSPQDLRALERLRAKVGQAD